MRLIHLLVSVYQPELWKEKVAEQMAAKPQDEVDSDDAVDIDIDEIQTGWTDVVGGQGGEQQQVQGFDTEAQGGWKRESAVDGTAMDMRDVYGGEEEELDAEDML